MRAVEIVPATAADMPALARLRSEQGWPPSPRLLATIESWEGGRILLIRASSVTDAAPSVPIPGPAAADAPIATVSAIAAGPLGVIGNVIVRADYRKRGLGRLIMEAALRWLRGRGVAHVVLAATPDGRPLYARLGFVDLAPSWLAHGPIAPLDRSVLQSHAGAASAALMPPGELGTLASLDQAAFGGERMGLLALLLRSPEIWLYVAHDPDAASEAHPGGYLILRRLRSRPDTLQIGPWVARTPAAAAALLAAALAPDATWCARFDPGLEPRTVAVVDRRDALALLIEAGATLVEDDIVMQLDFAHPDAPDEIGATGGPPCPIAAHPDWLYAWLAPMVF
jgi:GNAT superfamily N-acetyltransferase